MQSRPRVRTGRGKFRGWVRATLLLVPILGLSGLVGWTSFRAESAPSSPPIPIAPQNIPQPQAAATAPARRNQTVANGTFVVTARVAGHSHILGYLPGDPETRQLTDGDWDDRDPAVSPNLDQLAFASSRDGNWDLYLLDLGTGDVRRLTETAGYEGKPTWSPDGLWLAFEAYYTEDLDIWILPIDGSQTPIQLTDHPGADVSPTWDPGGRRIAFVSDRDGAPDVFLADLDKPTDRFSNLTRTVGLVESDPSFSPDGSQLAFSIQIEGVYGIQRLNLGQAGGGASWVGQGEDPAWISDGRALSGILRTPYQSHVVTYPLEDALSTVGGSLGGRISQLHWSPISVVDLSFPLPDSPDPLYEVLWDEPRAEGDRMAVVPLAGVTPAGLTMSDAADEAFEALRAQVAVDAGWDFLSQLQYAFVGVNDPLPPGYAYNDWLFTGRAFAISQAAYQAGWLEVVREDFGLQTYWRIFVRASAQDGSRGEPLPSRPWNFQARYAGDPAAYDQGGAPKESIPAGYYVDFTALAADFGFERLPALANWRSFYAGARFGEFALRDSLDWVSAMRQLYPDSAIATPTPYQTPTPTPTNTPRPTPTPWWWRWRTPTPSAQP